MQVIRFFNKENFGNSYAVVEGDKFVLIDCTKTPEYVASRIGDICVNGIVVKGKDDSKILQCVGVFVTHGHYDHFSNLEDWLRLNVPVFADANAFKKFEDIETNCSSSFDKAVQVFVPKNLQNELNDGQILNILGVDISVHKLSGHTDCSIALEIEDNLFVGDIIFAGNAYGRCDLPTGSVQEMGKTLQKINEMRDELIVKPGHGLGFRLGDSKPFGI